MSLVCPIEAFHGIFEFLTHLVDPDSLTLDGIGMEKLERGTGLSRKLYGALHTVLHGSVAIAAGFVRISK